MTPQERHRWRMVLGTLLAIIMFFMTWGIFEVLERSVRFINYLVWGSTYYN